MERKSKLEQDAAAGGEVFRRVKLSSEVQALASVSIHHFAKGHQLWGYLRFKSEGKNYRYYIGKVSAKSRGESLQIGWRLVRKKRVLERAGFAWLVRGGKNR